MANFYTADGGVTKTPEDSKSNSLFGGGVLGGTGLAPYLNDYSLNKTMGGNPTKTTTADPYYKVIDSGDWDKPMDNNTILILLAVILGVFALVKSLID